ncbi:MAG: hypothetical protein U0838_14380 [Chloroflexota bacterium]
MSANIVRLDDQALSATTDLSGAFALTVGVQSGQSLKVQAKSPTTHTSPDAEDCIYLDDLVWRLGPKPSASASRRR